MPIPDQVHAATMASLYADALKLADAGAPDLTHATEYVVGEAVHNGRVVRAVMRCEVLPAVPGPVANRAMPPLGFSVVDGGKR